MVGCDADHEYGSSQSTASSSADAHARVSARIGPARRGYDDPSYVHEVHAFDGNGLRPFSPVHLRAEDQGGTLALSWIRRTRIDGDDWELAEVPLGEEQELYEVRVMQGETVLRSAQVATPQWSYDPAQDGLSGSFEIAVAQVSARYGPGPFARLSLTA